MQCNTSPSHRVDQVVNCGLWNFGPLLFNGCVKLLDIGRNWNTLKWIGWIDYLGKGEVLTNTDLDRFVNNIWDKYAFCVHRFQLMNNGGKNKSVAFIILVSVYIFVVFINIKFLPVCEVICYSKYILTLLCCTLAGETPFLNRPYLRASTQWLSADDKDAYSDLRSARLHPQHETPQ